MLSGLQEIEHDVFSRLQGLGYRVLPTTGCPFDALSSASSRRRRRIVDQPSV